MRVNAHPDRSLPQRVGPGSALLSLVPEFTSDVLGVVAITFSRFAGERRDRKGGDIYELNRFLIDYDMLRSGRTPAESQYEPPTVRHARGVLWELGVTRSDVRQRWEALVAEHGRRAVLDAEILLALYCPAAWRGACGAVLDGPGVAVALIEQILHLRARRPVPARGGCPSRSGLSRATLLANLAPMRAFMNLLVDGRRRGFPGSALQRWDGTPKVRVPQATAANADYSAPAVLLLRRTYARLDAEVKGRLGVVHEEDQLPRARTIGPTKLKNCGVWRRARNRAHFGLDTTLGGRSAAICDLSRGDVVRDHRGPDGSVGPAVALRPGKTEDDDVIHWKPIPWGLFDDIEIYLVLTDRLLTETSQRGRPARPAPPGPDAPLFIGELTDPEQPMWPSSFTQTLAGTPASAKHKRRARQPLLPRGGGRGHTQRSLRRAALQMTRQAAADYCREHRTGVSPEAISEALIDHRVATDIYGYADVKTLAGREKWSGVAARLNWEMVTGERGARRTVDWQALRAATEQRAATQAELDRQQARLTALIDDAETRRRFTAETAVRVQQVVDAKTALHRRLDELDREITRLQTDPNATVPVADDIPDADLHRLEETTLHQDTRHHHPKRCPVRDFYTVPELQTLYEISRPQACRWANGQSLPHRPGDPRRPFEPGALPIDDSLGPRKKRIWAGGLSPGSLPTLELRERAVDLLCDFPNRWKEEDCRVPLSLPDPYRSGRGNSPNPVLGFLADYA